MRTLLKFCNRCWTSEKFWKWALEIYVALIVTVLFIIDVLT